MMTTRPRPAPERWSPPHDADQLRAFADRLRVWQPVDVDALLDDVADALDDVPPAAMYLPDLIRRLHAGLDQLMNIAVANEAGAKDDYVAQTLGHSETLRASPLPAEPAQAHLRQVGWAVNELVDRLVAAKYMRGPE
ncbi:DUF6415 family natural product biosynthesis protein [Streptomyces sp. NPDC050095]|uniref:DUF6415 family natural product biosynthesis protein n=1 Tax=unclassified Streptomyces TaxID=2593676 RepID=UPI0034449787